MHIHVHVHCMWFQLHALKCVHVCSVGGLDTVFSPPLGMCGRGGAEGQTHFTVFDCLGERVRAIPGMSAMANRFSQRCSYEELE